jgi:hypothetical protein
VVYLSGPFDSGAPGQKNNGGEVDDYKKLAKFKKTMMCRRLELRAGLLRDWLEDSSKYLGLGPTRRLAFDEEGKVIMLTVFKDKKE